MMDATTCKHADGPWTWHLAPCNEDGWHCSACRRKAPGDPDGYRPDLDRECLEDKAMAILMDLSAAELVYVSNSTDGEYAVRRAAGDCRERDRYDQYSILQALLGYLNRTHGDYWAKIGAGVVSGRDPRERCDDPGCGKLAASFTLGGPKHCREHGMPRLLASLTAAGPESDIDPWEAFGTWEAKWREDHPDDDRDSLALIDEYARTEARP